MVASYTPNVQLIEPARGDDVGTWDTPVNANMTEIDLIVGGITTISLNNSNIVLSNTQFQSRELVFNSTLTGSVSITFPTSFIKDYIVSNLCTGSSAFTVTLETTSGGQVICCPPGQTVQCYNDGSNLKFVNFGGPIGTYLDYAGLLPGWITGCTVPPYLDCNGTTFSSATYPILATILGSTTLPDFRGRKGFYLNEGTGRLTTGGAGIDGGTLFATGGGNGVTLSASMIPNLNSQAVNTIGVTPTGGGNVPTTGGAIVAVSESNTGPVVVPAAISGAWSYTSSFSGNNNISVNTQGTGGGTVPDTTPGIVGGIRMIRAG